LTGVLSTLVFIKTFFPSAHFSPTRIFTVPCRFPRLRAKNRTNFSLPSRWTSHLTPCMVSAFSFPPIRNLRYDGELVVYLLASTRSLVLFASPSPRCDGKSVCEVIQSRWIVHWFRLALVYKWYHRHVESRHVAESRFGLLVAVADQDCVIIQVSRWCWARRLTISSSIQSSLLAPPRSEVIGNLDSKVA